MSNPLFLIHTNATPGREVEFDEWYTDQHLSDVLAVPGFVSAQRYRKADLQRDEAAAAFPYRHLAAYEISGDPASAFAALSAAVRDGLYLSPALHPDRIGVLYDQVTDRITG